MSALSSISCSAPTTTNNVPLHNIATGFSEYANGLAVFTFNVLGYLRCFLLRAHKVSHLSHY
jgi:hypothetical protein